MPDRFINTTIEDIETMFHIIRQNGLKISQPSIKVNKSIKSYVREELKKTDSLFRKSKFVETKMPCFETKFVMNELLPFLLDNKKFLKSGWGLDLWWSFTYPSDLYVIDTIEILDTPIVNGMKDMKHFKAKYKFN